MKAEKQNTENEKPMFAFMHEMVIDHLKHAKPAETIQNSDITVLEKITIVADPDIPSLDGVLETNVFPVLQKVKNKKKKKK
jgi:hypothetical protein